MKTTSQFAVTFGRLDFFAEEGLTTVFLSSAKDVKDMANQFITVIPDDLKSYKKDIKNWDGKSRLLITHQDDDTFYFSAITVPSKSTTDLNGFNKFVSDFAVDASDD